MKPSDIYTSTTKAQITQFMKSRGLRPIAFQEPLPGDMYLTAPSGTATCIGMLDTRYGSIRLIVKKINPNDETF